MRHSVALKFIAVLLCAASLLGVVAGAGSMLALTGLGLYNQTVDEYVDQQVQGNGEYIARQTATRYASEELGGCPQGLLNERYGSSGFPYFLNDYYGSKMGYVLKDAEGSEVDSVNPEIKETATVYTFTPEGKYMHLVSAEPVPEEEPDTFTPGLVDVIPDEGVQVHKMTVAFTTDSSESISAGGDSLGFLYRETDGSVAFWSNISGSGSIVSTFGDVYSIEFRDGADRVIYSSYQDGAPVGQFYIDDNGRDAFRSYPPEADNSMSFYGAVLYGTDGQELLQADNLMPLGTLFLHTDGSVEIQFHQPMALTQVAPELGGLALTGENGQLLFSVRGIGHDPAAGALVVEDEQIIYLPYAQWDMTPSVAASETAPVLDEASAEDVEALTAGQPEAGEPAEDSVEAEPPAEDPGDVEPLAEDVEEPEPPAEDSVEGEPLAEDGEEPEPPAEDSEEGELLAEDEGEPEPPAEDGGEGADEVTEATEVVVETEATEAPTEPPTTAHPATEAVVAAAAETWPEFTEPVYINGLPLDEYGVNTATYWDQGEEMEATYVYVDLPEYTLELYLAPGAMRYGAVYDLLRIVTNYRDDLLLITGVCGLIFLALAVYLCCAAGHWPKTEEIRAGGLNRLPLDLYFGIVALCVTGAGFALIFIVQESDLLLDQSLQVGLGLGAAAAYAACLSLVGFIFAIAAQAKTPGHFWLKNTLCVRCLAGIWWLTMWCWNLAVGKLLPWTVRLVKGVFRFCWNLLGRCFRACARWTNSFLRLLPLTWQWLLGGMVLLFVGMLVWANRRDGWSFLWLLIGCGLVLYLSKCFGVLLDGTKRMSKGDLDTKIDDKRLLGCFQEFAGDLNDLADVAVVAAQKQLKSERMKTELITNVSHDIKTPLTSIINYVDLLQKPHTEEEQAVYLEVLERQSQRLKKLIEDLMDMSKASTGNMSVDIIRLNAVEAVNQALGEFADKLEKAQLIPVFRHGSESVYVMADGRLLWRVLSNLLGNMVKYAMPGTRVYVDLMEAEGKVVISLKNISRDELNVDAEELMERFVRGDDSRNTEGSGLGLNIAKSLMELQKGQLQLLVDGDLFKITLIFPGA